MTRQVHTNTQMTTDLTAHIRNTSKCLDTYSTTVQRQHIGSIGTHRGHQGHTHKRRIDTTPSQQNEQYGDGRLYMSAWCLNQTYWQWAYQVQEFTINWRHVKWFSQFVVHHWLDDNCSSKLYASRMHLSMLHLAGGVEHECSSMRVFTSMLQQRAFYAHVQSGDWQRHE